MNILEHLGVSSADYAELNTFKPSSSTGRVLLYDGDGACYTHTANVAKVATAFRRLENDILENMVKANCSSARVHLTPTGCFKNGRHLLKTAKPYQGNRVSKPKSPILDELRMLAPEYFKDHPDIQVFSHYDIEADDALMIDAFKFSNTCMISPDKDLNINPFESYCLDTGRTLLLPEGDTYGWIKRKQWLTDSGKPRAKVIGKGAKFYWAQMLMGDQADNVQGILNYKGKLCGEAGAFQLLDPIDTEAECANLVIEGYREINQNVVAEAEAMWLLRNRDDSGLKYLQSLDLTPLNKQFLDDCVGQGYKQEADDESAEVTA